MHFFALRVTTSLKIPGAVIPRRVFTRSGPETSVRRNAAILLVLGVNRKWLATLEMTPITHLESGMRIVAVEKFA